MNQALQRASALVRQGRLKEAEATLAPLLDRTAPSPEALHLMGICRLQQGDPQRALRLISQAVEAKAAYASAWCDRGVVLDALGRHDEALASYERALQADPGFRGARFNLGVGLERLQRYAEAAECYQAVLALQEDHIGALVNLGNVLCRLGRYPEALARYDRALALQPDLAVARTNRGTALMALNRFAEALADQRLALAANPGYAFAWNNQGIALAALGRHEEAVQSYARALACDPGMIDARQNRANSLAALKRYAEAASDYEQVLGKDPQRPYALGSYLYALAQACEWRNAPSLRRQAAEAVRSGKPSVAPFAFLSFSTDLAEQLACARACVADKYPPASPPAPAGKRSKHDRIRLAYLSADFNDHALAHLMAGLFELHDRSRFEVWGVSLGVPAPGPMRDRLVRAFEHFIDVHDLSVEQAADRLRALEIDIAVELNGFTEGSRLGVAARRPAPLQVSYMGYPGTLAAGYIDYLIADRVVVRHEEARFYSEKLVYMPESYFVNDGRRATGGPARSRREAGLPDGAFVFCCFNSPYKITPEIFDVWMRLLLRRPGSVLWLLSDNPDAPANLRREAQARGVGPDRIVFAPRVGRSTYLANLRLADLFLDTLPYNAHTTACDALRAGLPLVTCAGTTFAGRVAASLLHALELGDLVTGTLQQYEALAFKLASDADALASLRQKLARNAASAPLFDTDRWRRHVEWAFTEMWLRHQRGEAPASFTVPALPRA
jgi:predicted O-linked N-acetylglucosamine transferase (SPINDLY family)